MRYDCRIKNCKRNKKISLRMLLSIFKFHHITAFWKIAVLLFLTVQAGYSKGHQEMNGNKLRSYLNCTSFNQEIKEAEAIFYFNRTNFNVVAKLAACIKAHPYEITQLPILVRETGVFTITYAFTIVDLLDLRNDGSLKFSSIFFLNWKDEFRTWNLSEMPCEAIYVHACESNVVPGVGSSK